MGGPEQQAPAASWRGFLIAAWMMPWVSVCCAWPEAMPSKAHLEIPAPSEWMRPADEAWRSPNARSLLQTSLHMQARRPSAFGKRANRQVQRQARLHRLQLDPGSSDFDTLQLGTNGNSTFLHIPKTGGTSVEEALKARGVQTPKYLFSQRAGNAPLKHQCRQQMKGIEKHYTPEQIVRCKGETDPYKGKTVFCFLRDPVERVVSELKYRKKICQQFCNPPDRFMWNFAYFGRAPMGSSNETELLTFANAVAFYVENLRREMVGADEANILSDHLVHLQPQAWYVFDEAGEQTCHKVKMMEDIGIGERRNVSKQGSSNVISDNLRSRLRAMLWKAYRDDFLLVEQLKTQSHFSTASQHDIT